ncbi:hypothetical protein G7Y89_g6548 [Cudoniella acicularis]|uniref:Uncharacterized protein n=1 Tax=Cudoniella acicularis TaxID=354080 RepID=A0A8H4RK91_9HELO|nr:hypothetical protein G7Y89_g6548 [Cudoniella acicularis]
MWPDDLIFDSSNITYLNSLPSGLYRPSLHLFNGDLRRDGNQGLALHPLYLSNRSQASLLFIDLSTLFPLILFRQRHDRPNRKRTTEKTLKNGYRFRVRWNLVRDRASEAPSEALLLFFFVLLLVARFLRYLAGDSNSPSLSPAQEASTPPPATPIPTTPIPTPIRKPSRPLPRLLINPIRIVPSVESSLPSKPSSPLSPSEPSLPPTPLAVRAEQRAILKQQIAQVRQEIAEKAALLQQASYSLDPPSPSPPTSPYNRFDSLPSPPH